MQGGGEGAGRVVRENRGRERTEEGPVEGEGGHGGGGAWMACVSHVGSGC